MDKIQSFIKYLPVVIALSALIGTWCVLQWRMGAMEQRMEKIETSVSSIQISVSRIEGKLDSKNLTIR
jgi:hypothetical protein